MKRVITVILAVALLVALAVPAVADAFTLYATKSGVKVYAKKDTSSRVYKKLSKGQKVLIEKKSGKFTCPLFFIQRFPERQPFFMVIAANFKLGRRHGDQQ